MAATDTLKALHTALVDARKGYETALQKADHETPIDLFQTMMRRHEESRARVQSALVEAGEKPDQDGSFMGTINQAVVTVRSAVTGLDDKSVKAFASGEESVLKRYDEAIREGAGAAGTADFLQRDREDLAMAIAKMREYAR